MKKIFFSLILLFSITLSYTQNLEEALSEKITELNGAYKKSDLQQLANDFERIALSDKENWLAN